MAEVIAMDEFIIRQQEGDPTEGHPVFEISWSRPREGGNECELGREKTLPEAVAYVQGLLCAPPVLSGSGKKRIVLEVESDIFGEAFDRSGQAISRAFTRGQERRWEEYRRQEGMDEEAFWRDEEERNMPLRDWLWEYYGDVWPSSRLP